MIEFNSVGWVVPAKSSANPLLLEEKNAPSVNEWHPLEPNSFLSETNPKKSRSNLPPHKLSRMTSPLTSMVISHLSYGSTFTCSLTCSCLPILQIQLLHVSFENSSLNIQLYYLSKIIIKLLVWTLIIEYFAIRGGSWLDCSRMASVGRQSAIYNYYKGVVSLHLWLA